MTYYVTQFGEQFFCIYKIKGYSGNYIFATSGEKITQDEYKKLYYSSDKREITQWKNREVIKIKGNYKEVLERR